jgi:hypothetical protein
MYVAKLFNLISPWRWSCRCQPWPPPHQPATCAAWSSRGHGPCGDERSRADSFLDGPSYAGLRHRQTETCENTLVNHGRPHSTLISALRIRSKNALCAIGWELHEPCTWGELKSMRWSRTLYTQYCDRCVLQKVSKISLFLMNSMVRVEQLQNQAKYYVKFNNLIAKSFNF